MRLLGQVQLLSLVALGALTPLHARLLQPTDRGRLALLLAVVNLALGCSQLGMTEYVAREVALGSPSRLAIGASMRWAGTAVLVVAAGSAIFVPLLSRGDRGLALLLYVGMGILPIRVYGLLGIAVGVGRGNWSRVRLAQASVPIMAMLGTAVVILINRTALVDIAAVWFIAYCSPFVIVASITGFPAFRLPDGDAVRALRFGLRSWAGSVVSAGNQRADQVIAAPFVSRGDLGVYAVAAAVATAPMTFSYGAGTYLRRVLPTASLETSVRLTRSIIAVLVVASLLSAPLAIFLVPALFGEAYERAGPMSAILLVGAVPLGTTAIVSVLATSKGFPGASAVAESVALIATGVLLLLTLPALGIWAAPFVSVTAYAIAAVLVTSLTASRLGLATNRLAPRPRDLVALASLLRDRSPS